MSLHRLVVPAIVAFGLHATPVAAQCSFMETGVPPDSANSRGSVFLGEALGQTFLAEALLIESITVWRVPAQAGYVWGMHLYINPTDSLGGPDVSHMLLNGPSVFNTDGDGVTPTPFEFVFDPPFQLPKLGTYELVVQSDPCGGIWDILAVRDVDYYPAGHAWKHSRSTDTGCPLRRFPTSVPYGDYCFRVRYCDIPTPIQRSTWGHLKALYR